MSLLCLLDVGTLKLSGVCVCVGAAAMVYSCRPGEENLFLFSL